MKKAKDRSNDFERLPWKSEAEKKRYYRSHCIGACEFTPCMCPKCRRERFEEQELKAAKEDLLEAYRRIEECREAMNSAVENIDDLTEEFPKLAELWKGFVKLGGISSHELEEHLGGKIIRAGELKSILDLSATGQ
jgi:hypothetical protein